MRRGDTLETIYRLRAISRKTKMMHTILLGKLGQSALFDGKRIRLACHRRRSRLKINRLLRGIKAIHIRQIHILRCETAYRRSIGFMQIQPTEAFPFAK